MISHAPTATSASASRRTLQSSSRRQGVALIRRFLLWSSPSLPRHLPHDGSLTTTSTPGLLVIPQGAPPTASIAITHHRASAGAVTIPVTDPPPIRKSTHPLHRCAAARDSQRSTQPLAQARYRRLPPLHLQRRFLRKLGSYGARVVDYGEVNVVTRLAVNFRELIGCLRSHPVLQRGTVVRWIDVNLPLGRRQQARLIDALHVDSRDDRRLLRDFFSTRAEHASCAGRLPVLFSKRLVLFDLPILLFSAASDRALDPSACANLDQCPETTLESALVVVMAERGLVLTVRDGWGDDTFREVWRTLLDPAASVLRDACVAPTPRSKPPRAARAGARSARRPTPTRAFSRTSRDVRATAASPSPPAQPAATSDRPKPKPRAKRRRDRGRSSTSRDSVDASGADGARVRRVRGSAVASATRARGDRSPTRRGGGRADASSGASGGRVRRVRRPVSREGGPVEASAGSRALRDRSPTGRGQETVSDAGRDRGGDGGTSDRRRSDGDGDGDGGVVDSPRQTRSGAADRGVDGDGSAAAAAAAAPAAAPGGKSATAPAAVSAGGVASPDKDLRAASAPASAPLATHPLGGSGRGGGSGSSSGKLEQATSPPPSTPAPTARAPSPPPQELGAQLPMPPPDTPAPPPQQAVLLPSVSPPRIVPLVPALAPLRRTCCLGRPDASACPHSPRLSYDPLQPIACTPSPIPAPGPANGRLVAPSLRPAAFSLSMPVAVTRSLSASCVGASAAVSRSTWAAPVGLRVAVASPAGAAIGRMSWPAVCCPSPHATGPHTPTRIEHGGWHTLADTAAAATGVRSTNAAAATRSGCSTRPPLAHTTTAATPPPSSPAQRIPVRVRRKAASALMAALLHATVSASLPILHTLSVIISAVSEGALSRNGRLKLSKAEAKEHIIRAARRQLKCINRMLIPAQSLVQTFARCPYPRALDAGIRPAMDAVKERCDFVSQLIATHESDADAHLAAVRDTQQDLMGKTMFLLTIISAVFLPLSFIEGVYGMNFNSIPEVHWSWGYRYFWTLSGSVAALVLLTFVPICFGLGICAMLPTHFGLLYRRTRLFVMARVAQRAAATNAADEEARMARERTRASALYFCATADSDAESDAESNASLPEAPPDGTAAIAGDGEDDEEDDKDAEAEVETGRRAAKPRAGGAAAATRDADEDDEDAEVDAKPGGSAGGGGGRQAEREMRATAGAVVGRSGAVPVAAGADADAKSGGMTGGGGGRRSEQQPGTAAISHLHYLHPSVSAANTAGLLPTVAPHQTHPFPLPFPSVAYSQTFSPPTALSYVSQHAAMHQFPCGRSVPAAWASSAGGQRSASGACPPPAATIFGQLQQAAATQRSTREPAPRSGREVRRLDR